MAGKVIGIDLSTTNSCVAVIDGGKAKVIENTEGGTRRRRWLPLPRTARFSSASRPSVRWSPIRRNTIYAIKRLIGRRYDDPVVAKDKALVPYKIVKGPNGDAWFDLSG